MRLTLIGKEALYKLNLPQVADGNYWISKNTDENEEKLINIQGRNGKWEMISTNQMHIINDNNISISKQDVRITKSEDMVVDKVILEEYHMYFIYIGNHDLYVLYCSPSYKNGMRRFKIKESTDKILIGSSRSNGYFLSYWNRFSERATCGFNKEKW